MLDTQLPAVAADLTGAALVQFQQHEASLRSSVLAGDTVTTATALTSAYVGGGCAGPTFLISLSVAYVRADGSPDTEPEPLKIELTPDGTGWRAADVTAYGRAPF